jgi:hypothetical protein
VHFRLFSVTGRGFSVTSEILVSQVRYRYHKLDISVPNGLRRFWGKFPSRLLYTRVVRMKLGRYKWLSWALTFSSVSIGVRALEQSLNTFISKPTTVYDNVHKIARLCTCHFSRRAQKEKSEINVVMNCMDHVVKLIVTRFRVMPSTPAARQTITSEKSSPYVVSIKSLRYGKTKTFQRIRPYMSGSSGI